ncbi:hypothetical protein BDP27DRAFT_1426009 [Rhodocollybia butyracea]|uniref:Uncharacterized protein n=1 Tax=Rhodocollybia butyracea TaxID=206335 RepID=A0A9P5PJA3_9AGAR|nr:hypothetical protein BDP27DRAFT_1426009 [Rhodocollybia butyracea]
MFSALRNLLPSGQSPRQSVELQVFPEPLNRARPRSHATEPVTPMSPLSKVTAQMAKYLESSRRPDDTLDGSPMPGSFLVDESAPPDASPTMEALETLLTAAVLTDSAIHDHSHSDHHKLFSPAAECYQDAGSKFPSSLQPLDLTTAMQNIAAVTKVPSIPKTPSVPLLVKLVVNVSPVNPSSPPILLHHHPVFLLLERLREMKHPLRGSFGRDAIYEERMKYRKSKTKETSSREQTTKEKRDCLRERMRVLNAHVCALYAPLIPESPIEVDADNLFNTTFVQLNALNQVLVLLAIICHLIIGLSIDQSTIRSLVDLDEPFSLSENARISGMPQSLPEALKRIDVDGRFDFYATCPSCSFSNTALPLKGKKMFPRLVTTISLARMVSSNAPYLVSSLSDYLACCLADPTYVEQSKEAIDSAFSATKSGKPDSETHNVFEAGFTKDFKGLSV